MARSTDTTSDREDADREEKLMYGSDPDTIKELNDKYPNRPHNKAKTLRFSDLYLKLFNPLSENRKKPANIAPRSRTGPDGPVNLTPHEARRQIIERFIARWRKEVGDDFYPVMRLMIPDKDRDRAMYGLKESMIGKLLVKVMKISKDSDDGYALMHWKLPGFKANSAAAGDFAGRCYEVISKRPMLSEPGTMTIAEVNGLLDQLSRAQKEENSLPIMEQFYTRMNPEELRWLIQIILRQIKIGASEKTILEMWHPDAESLFNISSSLRRVCWELSDPRTRLSEEDSAVQLMQCFQPQLAEFKVRSMDELVTKMKPTETDNQFWIEEKLDGERMQLHMMKDSSVAGGFRFAFWSRKGKDYTYLYGEGYNDSKSALTQHLRGAFHHGVQNIILDGEMITWDPKMHAMVPFGSLKTAALAEQANPFANGNRPLFKIFDCLLMNDKDLTRYEMRVRRAVLEQSVTNIEERFEKHEYTVATQASEIETKLREVVEHSSEGLVVKSPRSAYKLNERNYSWIKVKPEYMTEFGEALDCVVIGGYYGSGKRGGFLSSYLCGLKVTQEAVDAGANPQKCYSFFKVGGGFSAADYKEVQHRTDGKWIKWDSKRPPTDWIILGGGDRQFERPDMWIKPEDSLVFEVKAASVHTTDQFGMKLTLRFPRLKKIRYDKDWKSALTVTEFTGLKNAVEAEKKEKQFQVESARRQNRAVKRKRSLVIVGQDENVTPLSQQGSKIFDDLRFVVLSDSKEPKRSKADIKSVIQTNGGVVVAAHKDPEVLIIADRPLLPVESTKKHGDRNIIRSKWLYDCVKQGELLPYEPSHMYFATPPEAEAIESNVDEYGDSYARDLDTEELAELFKSMPVQSISLQDARQVLAQEGIELDDDDAMYFVGLLAYFDKRDKAVEDRFELAGGKIAASIDEDVTHVIIDDLSRRRDVLKRISHKRVLPRVVTRAWIEACWGADTRLDEERFTAG